VRAADAAGEPLLVLGGGSNLVVADDGLDGTVLQIATRLASFDLSFRSRLHFDAGVDWDWAVEQAVTSRMSGIEALSGIPGLMGAAPIQNIGAYGQEIAQSVASVRVYDRTSGDVVRLAADECGFSYRTSVFKGSPRYVVLSVSFDLEPSPLGAPIRYAELAQRLGVELGARVPAVDVRQAVLELRRSKGMVLDPTDHDTGSAGSFFTNPLLPAEEADRLLPADAPRWPDTGGRVKTSAAWLIERSGFGRGYGEGAARISTKHTLALTNRGGATTTELVALARTVRDGVRAHVGIDLVPEPTLVGCSL